MEKKKLCFRTKVDEKVNAVSDVNEITAFQND